MNALPAAWAAALAARRAHFDLDAPATCLRLLHGEDPHHRCDRFGPVLWFYRYLEDGLTDGDRAACDALTRAAGARHWHLHAMADRGRDPQARRRWRSPGAPDRWEASEGALRYELRADHGQSPGLFVDQRRNRAWVAGHARQARVLNLFCYTGAFGLAALSGGAVEVVQADVSRPYLDWARANAALNGWDDPAHDTRIEHAPVDARLLLAGCRKRGRRFDGIVCDPPSFARGGGGRRGARDAGPFRVQTDLPELVRACLRVLAPSGWLLVSSNYEGWSAADFEDVVGGAAPGLRLEPAPGPGPDLPPGGGPGLNSCVVRKV